SECRSDPGEPLQGRGFVIDDFPPLQRIALCQMRKRAPRVTNIGEGFAQREVQIDLVRDVERTDIAPKLNHCPKQRVGGSNSLGSNQIPITGGPARRLGDGAIEGAYRLVEPAERAQCIAESIVSVDVSGGEGYGFLAMRERLVRS